MLLNLLLTAVCAFCIGVLSIILIARDNGLWIAGGSWGTASGNVFVRTRIYSFCLFGWYPFVRLRFRYWARTPEYRSMLAAEVRDLLHVQGVDGTWNHSPYQQGMYNGLEVATALLEQREAEFREPPQQWLCDLDSTPDNDTMLEGVAISLTVRDDYDTCNP